MWSVRQDGGLCRRRREARKAERKKSKGENSKMKNQIFRQGDVMIRRIGKLPSNKLTKRESGILAYGEVTGHAHRIDDLAVAEVMEVGDGMYLRVGTEGVRIIHDEHAPISLPAGNYEVTIQREYSPAAIRNVAD